MKIKNLIWFSIVFAGIFLGTLFPLKENNTIHNPEEKRTSKEEIKAIELSHQENIANKRRIDTSSTVTNDKLLVLLKSQDNISDSIDILAKSLDSAYFYDNLDQLVVLQSYLRSLSKEDLFEFAIKWGELSNKNLNCHYGVHEITVYEILDVDPQEALNMVGKYNWSSQFFYMADKWTSEAPLSFLEYIKNSDNDKVNTSEGTRLYLKEQLYSVFAKIWEYDRGKAFEEILKLPDNGDRERAISGISGNLKDNQDFIELAMKLNKNNLNVNPLFYSWPQKHPEEAILWVQDNKDKLPSSALDQIIKNWLQSDTAKASDWVMKKADNKKQALFTIINNQNNYNPAVFQWISSYLKTNTAFTDEEKKEILNVAKKTKVTSNAETNMHKNFSNLLEGEQN